MNTRPHLKPRFAVCIDNSQYPASLELHKVYRVVPDDEAAKDGDLRVIDESGEGYLFPAEWFVPVSLPEKAEAFMLGLRSPGPATQQPLRELLAG